MEPFAGTIGAIIVYFLTTQSAKLVALDTQIYGMPIWKVSLAIHIICCIAQFIGHGVFEGTVRFFLSSERVRTIHDCMQPTLRIQFVFKCQC